MSPSFEPQQVSPCLQEETPDCLSSEFEVSFRPSCQASFRTTFRSERRDSHLVTQNLSEFITTTFSVQVAGSVVKDDCVRSRVVERHSLLLSNFQIGVVTLYSVVFSTFVCNKNSGFRHVVIPLLVYMYGDKIHDCVGSEYIKVANLLPLDYLLAW